MIMKTKVTILLLLLTLVMTSQNSNNRPLIQFWNGEYFEFAFFTDPVASVKENGFLIGAEIQLVQDWFYVRTSITNFDALESGYWDWITGLGTSLKLFNNDRLRYYAGGQAGLIRRDGLIGGETYPTVGIEAGIDLYLGKNLVIGGRVIRNYRSDFDFWETNVEDYWVNNGHIRVGWTW